MTANTVRVWLPELAGEAKIPAAVELVVVVVTGGAPVATVSGIPASMRVVVGVVVAVTVEFVVPPTDNVSIFAPTATLVSPVTDQCSSKR